MKTAVIVGGGISGSTVAYLLAQKGWDVTIMEKESYLGGGFKTFYYGGHPYTLGPRPLTSRCEEKTGVYRFVNDIIPMRILEHTILSYVERDGNFYSYPIHEDDVARMPDEKKIRAELEEIAQAPGRESADFEEFWVNAVGPTLYDKFINNYSRKMWSLRSNKELKEFKWSPKGKTLKSGPRHLSTDYINAYPFAYDGYDGYFTHCTQNVRVMLSSPLEESDLENMRVRAQGQWMKADVIVNTISLDDFMGPLFGELPYLGRDFIKLVLPVEHAFPPDTQYLYYPNDEEFLRVVEYKRLTFYESPSTLLVMEFPSPRGKLYPLPLPEPKAQAQKYLDALPANVYALGRLGTYTYNIDMEGIILQAFDLVRKIEQ